MARKAREHVYGPYPGKIIGGHRSFRVVYVDGDGGRSSASLTGANAEQEATEAVASAKAKLAGRKVNEAISDYLADLAESGNRPSGIESTGHRLRTFFQVGSGNGGLLSEVTRALAHRLLEATKVRTRLVWVRGGHMKRKKIRQEIVERPRSVAYRAGMLAEAQTFARWCAKRGWLAVDKLQRTPLDGLEVKGRRNKRKVQMRMDEIAPWERVALDEHDRGDALALAAVVTFYFGTRAGETLQMEARDIDRAGTWAWVADSKTESGKRRVEIPNHLRDRLVARKQGRAPDAPLFAGNVGQLRRAVRRLCKAAGVTGVTTQALRGLHSTAADEAGATGPMIARQLGHADAGQTSEQHYSAAGARSTATQRRALRVIAGGKP